MKAASRAGYDALLAQGVAIAEFAPTMMHVKAMTVDGVLVDRRHGEPRQPVARTERRTRRSACTTQRWRRRCARLRRRPRPQLRTSISSDGAIGRCGGAGRSASGACSESSSDACGRTFAHEHGWRSGRRCAHIGARRSPRSPPHEAGTSGSCLERLRRDETMRKHDDWAQAW